MRYHPADAGGLDRFAAQIKRRPVLTREEEAALARRYRTTGDRRIAAQLVEANLRFVLKMAHAYSGYGLELEDLVQEGSTGLVVAVKKFDPDRGNRLISYAVWWIGAFIKSFVIANYSLVKIGTTQQQRRLFFRLRAERDRAEHSGQPLAVDALAKRLHVRASDVRTIEDRMRRRDAALEACPEAELPGTDGVGSPAAEASPEEQLVREELREEVRSCMLDVWPELSAKHAYVLVHRILADEPERLSAIGEHLSVSRERVRQIEASTLRRLRQRLERSVCAAA